MSERSNVSIAEILGDNYYIDKLTSNDYSPSVGDTVTITLLVKDVFGDPANGQTRTVTCTGGQFVSVNGTGITASSSVEVTTGSGGTVTLGLSVSVADNIIVSDGRVECVVSSLSTSITNIMQYTLVQTLASDKVKVYANSFNVYVVIYGSFSVTANAQSTLATINSNYAPSVSMPHSYHNNVSDDGKVTLTSDGSVLYNNKTTSTTRSVFQGFYYPLRSALP